MEKRAIMRRWEFIGIVIIKIVWMYLDKLKIAAP